MDLTRTGGYELLLDQIATTYSQVQGRATQAVNKDLIGTYWRVGRQIVEFEEVGNLGRFESRTRPTR